MKLNGALKPQQGASSERSSIGAKKYCNKQCEIEGNSEVACHGVSLLGNCISDSFKNNNDKINNSNSNRNCSCSCINFVLNDINKENLNYNKYKSKENLPLIYQTCNRTGKAIINIQLNENSLNSLRNTEEEKHLCLQGTEQGEQLKSFQKNPKESVVNFSFFLKQFAMENIMKKPGNENKEENHLASRHVKKSINIVNKESNQKSNELGIKNYFKCHNINRNQNQNNNCENNTHYENMSIKNFVLGILFGVFSLLSSFDYNYFLSLWTCWLKVNVINMVARKVMRVLASLQAIIMDSYILRSKNSYSKTKWLASDNFKWNTSRTLFCLGLLMLVPSRVVADENNFFGVNSFSMEPESTTPQFDYASRGQKKFGDKCENTLECGFPGSICDPKKKSCQCTEDLPITNHIDKCGKEAAVNESCFFNEQCEVKHFQTECRDGRCACRFEMSPFWDKDGNVECKGRGDKKGNETYIDPAMIFILVGMALMFVIICVVLRLFSQARWRENRTIFNTPNPRLMNVSLLRESKLIHGQERRGSRMSVRGPSRQPSMASLRPHSPNPSLGKTGSGSNSHGSNASASSMRSNSVAPGNVVNGQNDYKNINQHQHEQHQHPHPHHQQQPQATNITTNPVAESVTVEIIEPDHH